MNAVACDTHERVGRAQVGVLAETKDTEQVAGGRVQVEVVAVVEVSVTRRDMAHDLRRLMDGIVVERRKLLRMVAARVAGLAGWLQADRLALERSVCSRR